MLRVSVVRAIFSSRISACARVRLKPQSRPAAAAPPVPARTLRKVRRSIRHLSLPGFGANDPPESSLVKPGTLHHLIHVPMSFRRFAFEDTINDTFELVPMDVRRKLDLSGRRLSLAAWKALPASHRRELAECDEEGFAALMDRVARDAERIAPSAAWREPGAIGAVVDAVRAAGLRFDPGVWRRLDDAARYALWRLRDSKKGPERLAAAIAELA